MKIKALSRSAETYNPLGTTAVVQPRNLNPEMHPFEKAREYTRALTAVKMERMFAKPFIAQLGNGHIDGVYSFAKDLKRLDTVASGSGDGEVKIWDLADRKEIISVKAHEGIVKGLCFTSVGGSRRLLSCATDKTVKLWDPELNRDGNNAPVATYFGEQGFNAVSHHRNDRNFATASGVVDIWDWDRQKPITTLQWGADTINTVKFNQSETSVLASAGGDRTLILYDLRTSSPLAKLVTTLRNNQICWNPMEPFNFATANEDHNVYIFDMRKMNRALNVLKDHVAAVMDVDYSPTGEELVTGSYDRTVRIFKAREGHSRDVYHTKRMQRVFSVAFTTDTRYVLSGSDDGNVRLWRAEASARSHVRSAKERTKLEYDAALKERYKHLPEIKRIARHRHVPQPIKKAGEIKKEEEASIKRKEENRRRHSRKKDMRRIPQREAMIVSRE
ncbi:WD40-repeat-containing domain protein [Pyronema domesticum]|uniref:DDB1- and CUL4-associated factor 13 n=1 Tax=Pyronema omphalodes (strain CBS 100304) TaxID=1076935 RepID=U4L9A4_PYROM|nr:WD40-repeat-containing domain protein [Pyronema domesticum]CCX13661.1 Similar to Protein SOF1; acc. no. P33750 [Pyronema omphalodes CBS 100304]